MNTSMERVNKIFHHSLFTSTLEEIEKLEEDRPFCLHGFSHAMDTARIAYILSLEEYGKIKKDIIYAASLLHDLGRASQYKSGKYHIEESVSLSKKILPECGFSKEEAEQILSAIKSHCKENDTGLASFLQRADKLSRICVNCKSIANCKWKKEELNMNILY